MQGVFAAKRTASNRLLAFLSTVDTLELVWRGCGSKSDTLNKLWVPGQWVPELELPAPWHGDPRCLTFFRKWAARLRYLKLERQLYDVTKQRMEEPGVSRRSWPWGLWVKLKGPDEVTAVPCGPRMLKRSRQIESDRTGNQRQNSRG